MDIVLLILWDGKSGFYYRGASHLPKTTLPGRDTSRTSGKCRSGKCRVREVSPSGKCRVREVSRPGSVVEPLYIHKSRRQEFAIVT